MIEPHQVKMLVEGGDDVYFVKHFAKQALGVELTLDRIENCRDIGKLLDRLDTIEKDTGYSALGVIVDADHNPGRRWDQLRSRAGQDSNSQHYLPPSPDANGTVVPFSKGRKIGVWMMPEPNQPGDMETFLSRIRHLQPQQLALWGHAVQAVQSLPQPPLFAQKDAHKAQLRTWLAWQKEPGAPYGLALSLGAFDLYHSLAGRFADWLRRLLE